MLPFVLAQSLVGNGGTADCERVVGVDELDVGSVFVALVPVSFGSGTWKVLSL